MPEDDAVYTPSGTSLTCDQLSRFYTVDGLFVRIQTQINSNVARLDVSYNALYGYPEDIYIDQWANAVDEEVGYAMFDFQ